MHRRSGLDVAGLVDQIMRELDRTHAARLERVQPVEVALQEVAALDGEHQRRIPVADVRGLAGDTRAGGLEAAEILVHRGQALARLRVAHLLQPPVVRIAPDHRHIGDGGNHGGRDAAGGHGGKHRAIHRTATVRAAGMGVHVDDHGWQAIAASAASDHCIGLAPGTGLRILQLAGVARDDGEQGDGRRHRHETHHHPCAGGLWRDARRRPSRGRDAGHDHRHVRPGVSTGTLDAVCHEFITAHGAVPAPLNYRGYPKSICTSINHVVCHGFRASGSWRTATS